VHSIAFDSNNVNVDGWLKRMLVGCVLVTGVVSAAVYVICELAAKNPKNYLSLAPQFFHILTSSSNNWVLIKVVKLFGSLVPLEPRLAKVHHHTTPCLLSLSLPQLFIAHFFFLPWDVPETDRTTH